MTRKKAAKSARDKAGYKTPPKSTQFKKGASGNPRGRPKGSRDLGTMLRDVIHRRVPVTEDGQIRHLPALEVMLHRAFNDALRKGPAAHKFFLSLIERYTEQTEANTAPDADTVLAEDEAILRRYMESPPPEAASPPNAAPLKTENK